MNDKFNDFAEWANIQVSRAQFFTFCIALVIIWLPSYLIVGNLNTWQLLINTPTTIITFLLVSLNSNDQQRFEDATNQKLNALAKGVGQILEELGLTDDARALYDVMHIEEDIKA